MLFTINSVSIYNLYASNSVTVDKNYQESVTLHYGDLYLLTYLLRTYFAVLVVCQGTDSGRGKDTRVFWDTLSKSFQPFQK